ncbi:MAG: enoyl-CoA hydratase/isomerase family protein, partial [bacterium]|nr:enoyl-CoA hydratase/isomerase family protein [bacterium]
MSEKQILSHVENRVGTITLNRPAAMNALAGSMREDLFACLEEFAADDRVGCVVITGAGKAFCAGGDIAAMAEKQAGDDSSMLEDRMTLIGEIVQLMRRMPKPVLAAINGAAAGGGMNMALACDMRVGSDKALFAQSFVKIGLVPDWGGFFLLTRLVGTSNAMEIM